MHSVGKIDGFYNTERPHTALNKRTPDVAYFEQAEIRKVA
jgi:putative transposase